MSDQPSRRNFLKGAAAAATGAAITSTGCKSEALNTFMRGRLQEVSPERMAEVLSDMEADYSKQFGRDVTVAGTPPKKDVLFGYGLDLSRCNGNRLCVQACVEENNQSRPSPDAKHHNPLEWITVFQMDKDKGIDFDHADAYYEDETVPAEGKYYFPVQCQQCENPPCVKVCPVKATWKENDGIVVIDYDWCIGCRCCMTACPYGARHFNWSEPHLPAEEVNPKMHVLGNRPRKRGVVEKCTFCIQRTREGLYPACHDACPTGARVFGNLLDPNSEIRLLMERKRVFVLKAELNTRPKFFYFYG
ncbi:MAG: 4Fe-4S dicluster domain-containing protein [Planctomycetota bacterium]|jgi:molybdopterin-containing oxidoreductase family iron-sulfur binding subunit